MASNAHTQKKQYMWYYDWAVRDFTQRCAARLGGSILGDRGTMRGGTYAASGAVAFSPGITQHHRPSTIIFLSMLHRFVVRGVIRMQNI